MRAETKKTLLSILAVAALILLIKVWFESRQSSFKSPIQRDQDAVSPVTQSTTEAPASITSSTTVGLPRRKVTGVSQERGSASGAPAPLPDGIVEFVVLEGYLVAYGDLILGLPEPEMKETRGYVEMKNPQSWDSLQIPYFIQPDVAHPERIREAIELLQQQTPIQFVTYDRQADAIVFEKGKEHCLSLLGKMGGLQPIRLSEGCSTQAVLHEILHALGMIHEHSRPDRDQYVDVVWSHIQEKFHSQFRIMPDSFSESTRNTPFDFKSVMLYSPTAFAETPGEETLKTRGGEPIAPTAHGMSAGDVLKLKRLFRL